MSETRRLFVRAAAGQPFTIILSGVEALNISSLRAGNIILDLALTGPGKLTVKHIWDAYSLESAQGEMSQRLLGKAQQEDQFALEINSSDGAEGTVLFRAVDAVSAGMPAD